MRKLTTGTTKSFAEYKTSKLIKRAIKFTICFIAGMVTAYYFF
jgi:hypothetical protein